MLVVALDFLTAIIADLDSKPILTSDDKVAGAVQRPHPVAMSPQLRHG